MTEFADMIERLDVREEMDKWIDPLPRILRTIKYLRRDQAAQVLASADLPKLRQLALAFGLDCRSRRLGDGHWQILVGTDLDALPNEIPDAISEGVALKIDVRGLGDAEPLVKIIDALDDLPSDQCLVVYSDTVPPLLFASLAERGWAAATHRIQTGGCRITIWRAA